MSLLQYALFFSLTVAMLIVLGLAGQPKFRRRRKMLIALGFAIFAVAMTMNAIALLG